MTKFTFRGVITALASLISATVIGQTTTFNYTGSVQSYTVPAGCTSILADVVGAQGGSAGGGTGGKGGRAQGTIAVTPGQTLYIYVASAGGSSSGSSYASAGSNSGGGAQGGAGQNYNNGGGGGGSSDIRTTSGSTTTALDSRLMVGGGGGGAGWVCGSGDDGGYGGGLTGGLGSYCSSYYLPFCGAAGTQSAGGTGGYYYGGGNGGKGYGGASAFWGGGGGGGYYGGGGGSYGGAAGGSSYYGSSSVTGGTTTSNFRSGNGYVAITPLVPSLVASPTSIDFGGVLVGSSSIPFALSISGYNLVGFPGNITLTSSSSLFELSLEGTIWSSTLTIPYTAASSTGSIFVRFSPTASGMATGSINVSGGGATAINVPLTGTGSAACTGTPTAGTAAISPSSGGPSTVFTLSLTGYTVSGGITFQWRSSPTGTAGTFTDIPGANSPTYSFSGLAATSYYQCQVTCPTYSSASSNTVSATYNLASASCTPSTSTGPYSGAASCTSYQLYVLSFSLPGESSTTLTDAAGCNSSGYLDRTSLSVTLAPGGSYTASQTFSTVNSGVSQLWIDFNNDGTFSSSETVGGKSTTYGATTFAVTIPSTVSPGTYRMRLVMTYSGSGYVYPSLNPCMTGYSYGEARDYKVVIQPSCSTPPSITGTNYACVTGTTTLANTASGGTWSSSNTSVATVSSSGVVTGVAAGTARVTYTVTGGCYTTRIVGVYSKPSVASVSASASTICANSTLNFTGGATSGGTVVAYNWSGPAGYSASTTGNTNSYVPLSSAATGAYSLTVTSVVGCVSNPVATSSITVNDAPAAFSGVHSVCEGGTTVLTTTSAGGTWTSGSGALASITPGGVVTGISSGLANISYTLPNTCSTVEVVTVNPLPDVTLTPSGSSTVCLGESANYDVYSPNPSFAILSQNFDGGLSGWTISNVSGSSASYWQIISATGVDGTPGGSNPMMQAASSLYTSGFTNTTLTSPSFSTLGFGSADLTMNQYLISTVPDAAVIIEYSVDGGSTWSTVLDQLNAFAGSPVWTASSPNTTISLPAGALGHSDVKLRFRYNASSFYWFVDDITVSAYLPASTYSWTGALGLGCTACTTQTITPTTVGANNYTITVTSSAGCITANNITVNANPLPGTITGSSSICVGSSFTLGNSVSGGTWGIYDGTVANISAGGVITGLNTGTTMVTYTLPTGCYSTTTVTVNPMPDALTGTMSVCIGKTTSLSHIVPGGTWVSTDPTVATVNAFGLVSGISGGTSMITYTLPSGCSIWTTVTVNDLPTTITGTAVMCVGQSQSLSSTPGGGTWASSASGIADVGPSGLVTGYSAGNAVVTYTLPTGCTTTRIVTINALPAAIAGSGSVCQGSTTTLTNTTLGGTWSSVPTTVATINASGVVTGMSPGFATIYYTNSTTGCQVSMPMIVNSLPSDITGTMEVCQNDMASLTSAPGGGTWTSSSATTASVDASGVITGMNAGTARISYTLVTGCRKTAVVTVDALPQAITGTGIVCEGTTTNLYDFTAGGGWSSNNPSIADVSPTGEVTGYSAGVGEIVYTLPTGCMRSMMVTVNALPATIGGSNTVCVNSSITLTNSDMGGTWSSSNAGVATVVSGTGVVTGMSAGVTDITYTLPTGCVRSMSVTVNALPANITGTATVCEGSMTPLADASAGGTWMSDDISIASVDASGVVTGQLQGTTNIIYTLPTGCAKSRTVQVNQTPSAMMDAAVCAGLTTTMSSSPAGGAWSSSSSAVAPVSSSGIVTGGTAGTAMISYTLPNGCRSMATVTVNALPASIGGTLSVCEQSTTTLTNTTGGGAWSTSNVAIGTINALTGSAGGVSAGTTQVTYTVLSTGCIRTATLTVNGLPAPISGVLNVCVNSTTSLTNSTGSGTWSSGNTSVASITSGGVVTGLNAGTSNITYTLPTGCKTASSLVVNALPADISGASQVCQLETITMTDATTGGAWTSSASGVASIDGSGVVTGSAAGSATITYSNVITGCYKTKNVVVNALPASISGNLNICAGGTTVLTDATIGGSWSSSDATVAPIVSTSGIATGANAGFTIITYTLPTGCRRTASLVVNSLPEDITGTMEICAGGTTQLDNATPGGTWTNSTMVGVVNSTGLVTGIAAGTVRITYTIGNSCAKSVVLTVDPLPTVPSGSGSVCPGMTTVWTNVYPSGSWTSEDGSIASVDAMTGVITGNVSGTTNITYTLPTGCMRSRTITVNPPVEAILGGGEVCAGSSLNVTDATTGGIWVSGNTTKATVDMSGMVTGVSAGTALISYVMPTGCMSTTIVTVNGLPANITGMASVCAGSMVTLSSTTAGGSWSSSDDAIATAGAGGVVTGVMAGSATITYTGANSCIKTRTIVVNALPVEQTVNGGGSYCAGGTGVNVGLDGTEDGVIYTLSSGSTAIATLTGDGSAADFGMQTGAGTYMVRAVNGFGCAIDLSGSATVTITALTTPMVSMSNDMGDTVCAGTTVTYTATGMDGGTTPTYTWSVGSTVVGTGATYSYEPVDGDAISVAFTSSDACPTVATVMAGTTAHVLANLTPSVSMVVGPNDTVCQGSVAGFYATAVNGGDAPVYTWLVNGSIQAGASAGVYTFVPTNGQTVQVKLNSNYRCLASNNVSSNVITMHVDSVYIPEVTIVADPGTLINEGQTVNFTTIVNQGGPAPKYQWLIKGVAQAGATSSTFSYSSFANGDSVTCVVVGSGECGYATINSVVMHVNPASVNGPVRGVSELRLMPNPNKGMFTITGKLGSGIDGKVSLEVTEVLGQVVYRSEASCTNGSLNEQVVLQNNLANGMYMLTVRSANDKETLHFVLQQ